jgi:hypothetical protein
VKTADTITRKELAGLTGGRISERTLIYREREWGFLEARVKYSRKPILYRKLKALLILRGLLEL